MNELSTREHQAAELFTDTSVTFQKSMARVKTFRSVAENGKTAGALAVVAERAALVKALQKWIRDSEGEDAKRGLQIEDELTAATAAATEAAEREFQAEIDGASLVFAHSALDAAASDYLKVVAKARPELFFKRFGRTKVELALLVGGDPLASAIAHIETQVDALERDSLPRKLEALIAVCHESRPGSPPLSGRVKDYNYDSVRLLALDRLRHDVVHHAASINLPGGEGDIDYMDATGRYLESLVQSSMGVTIVPKTYLARYGFPAR